MLSYHRWLVGLFSVFVLAGTYDLFFSAPTTFAPETVVHIAAGMPLPNIATELADAHIIRSPLLLRALLKISLESSHVQMGTYKFAVPQNVFHVAYRLVMGDYGIPLIRMTFVEGFTLEEATGQVESAFGNVDAQSFSELARAQEGYLFPDTYFFPPSADAKMIIETMRLNFDKKVATLSSEVAASGHSISDIVTMASIIEGEASSTVDRHMVSGILWNRIKLNMPLQVDVAKETYTHRGLPPTPINNPSLDSLEAATNPTTTKYLYYLTGHDGLMHYATTYSGHQSNLRKYLQ